MKVKKKRGIARKKTGCIIGGMRDPHFLLKGIGKKRLALPGAKGMDPRKKPQFYGTSGNSWGKILFQSKKRKNEIGRSTKKGDVTKN